MQPENQSQFAAYNYAAFRGLPHVMSQTKDQSFLFTSKSMDTLTGLSYYGYRYYSAEFGKWISRDPIGEDGGLNLYGMVGNDPVTRIDILGLIDYKAAEESEMFRVAREAGIKAIDEEHSKARKDHAYIPVEWGGNICYDCEKKHYFVTTIDAKYRSQLSVDPKRFPPCPNGTSRVGFWHSHIGGRLANVRPGEGDFHPGSGLSGRATGDPKMGDTDQANFYGVPIYMTRKLRDATFETTAYDPWTGFYRLKP